MSDEYIEAIVQKVFEQGPHGPYAIAKADGFEGSITFSLEPTVWQENEFPKPGDSKLLHDSSLDPRQQSDPDSLHLYNVFHVRSCYFSIKIRRDEFNKCLR